MSDHHVFHPPAERKTTAATARALLAFDLARGACAPTRGQAVKAVRASWGYVSTLAHATEAEREQVRCGTLSLSALHSKRAGEVTENEIEAFVDRAGLGRLWLAIDKRTAPMRDAAE